MTDDLYRDYTRTQALAEGVDEQAVLSWSAEYFRSNFGRDLPPDLQTEILEVGCGYGRYIKALKEMGYRNCRGIDTSPDQVEYARRILGLEDVLEADALAYLEGKKGAFDVIFAIDVMEHMDLAYLLKFGKAVHAALKTGGRLIVQVPNGLSPMNHFIYGDLTHVRAFTPTSVNQLFLLSGMRAPEMSEIPPLAKGLKGVLRRGIWVVALKPALALFMLLMHGRIPGHGIYTGNLKAIGAKA